MMNRRLNRHKTATGIIFLLPALVFVAFALVIPSIENIILSFQEWDGFNERTWVGFANYREIFADSTAQRSFYNSVFLAFVTTVGATTLGVLLAALIYALGNREGAVYRLIFFMPVMIPLSIIGLLFTFIYNPEMGILNQFLRLVGLGHLTTAWLENFRTVMWSLSVVGVWRISGLTMVLCFAAMKMIPTSLLESAVMEGAHYLRQLTTIILPLIRPTIRLSAVFTLAISFKTYDLVFIITRGGPAGFTTTIPLYMIDTGFGYSEFGYSSAMGFSLTMIVMVSIFSTIKIIRGEQHEY